MLGCVGNRLSRLRQQVNPQTLNFKPRWRRRDEEDTDADDATDWVDDEEVAAGSHAGPLSSRDGASSALQVTHPAAAPACPELAPQVSDQCVSLLPVTPELQVIFLTRHRLGHCGEAGCT